MRICLILEYDGTHFNGWQSQPNKNTIQDYLNDALALIANHTITTIAAGRTDTGVHALSQVVHFDTVTERPMSTWVRGVNAHLPATIRVQRALIVDNQFHARFDAHQRSYQYLLVNSSVAPAVLANKAGWYHAPLNIKAMQEAISYLQGSMISAHSARLVAKQNRPSKPCIKVQLHSMAIAIYLRLQRAHSYIIKCVIWSAR